MGKKCFITKPEKYDEELAYIDAEGGVRYRINKKVITPRLGLGVKNKKIRDDLVTLLQKIGKVINIKFPVWTWESKDGTYHFEFAGPKTVVNYMKYIGFYHPDKKERIENLINNYFSTTVKAKGANQLS